MMLFQKIYIYIIIGVLLSYIMLDFYIQAKTELSLIQVIKIAETDVSTSKRKKDDNVSNEVDVFYLTINGFEHNFSFTGVKFESIAVDSLLLQKVKFNKKEKFKQ